LFEKDNVFGGSLVSKFGIGDIVSWSAIEHYHDSDSDQVTKVGILSELKKVIRSERPVMIARVLELETGREKEILLVSISLVSKAKENRV
jgi:hypothetical protein